MELIIKSGSLLHGKIGEDAPFHLPGDKSISHRAVLLASAAKGVSKIENFLSSGVTRVMLDALSGLGNEIRMQGGTLQVTGKGLFEWETPGEPLFCGNSATTMRLLAGAVAAGGKPAVLVGSEGLHKRPMSRIVEPLQKMGVPIACTHDGTAPLTLDQRVNRYLTPVNPYILPVASAQVKTCLLLAGLGSQGETTLIEPALSRDHTERMLTKLGIPIESRPLIMEGKAVYQTRMWISQPCAIPAFTMVIQGDFSSAAFILAAALITPGASVEICGVGLNPTRTGLLDVLIQMGGDIEITSTWEEGGELVGNVVARYSSLKAVDISGETVVRMIDEFPIFAVVACYSHGRSRIYEAEELRHKESDRITSLCAELIKLGANIQETSDGFIIDGHGSLVGGVVDSHGDHRLAMSMAVAGLAAYETVKVCQADIVNESFPEFAEIFTYLGANISWENRE